MLKFRAYTPEDGNLVASWVTDEWTLRVWSANCYERWPVTGEEINRRYQESREQEPSFRPLIAEEDGVPVGHMILQYKDPAHTIVHFGFVIMDPACRGKGLGSQMLRIAIAEAVSAMGCDTVELMVLDCNKRAYRCYLALGFEDVPESTQTMDIHGTSWVRHKMKLHCR